MVKSTSKHSGVMVRALITVGVIVICGVCIFFVPALNYTFGRFIPLPVYKLDQTIFWSTTVYPGLTQVTLSEVQKSAEKNRQTILVDKVLSQSPQFDLGAETKRVTDALLLTAKPSDSKKSLSKVEERQLKDYVIKNRLKEYYNSKPENIENKLVEARSILGRLQKGYTFDDLEKQYNENPQTTSFLGYTGFIPAHELRPEFSSALQDKNIGDYVLVSSYQGQHILYVEAKQNQNSEPQYSLREIFFQSKGFDQWLQSQLETIKIKYYVRG